MAITPLTGFKAFTFDGEKSTDYGVQILGEGVFNAPEREVEMINIPGRNGAFALDKGRFENIEVTYPANIIADSAADFAAAVSDLRNMLCSRRGYVRLQDDYHPDEYRMAVYKSGLEVDEKVLRAGEFDITFDCKPQRFLTSGEEPVTIGEWHETETASGEIASFEAKEGDAVKSLVVDIEPYQSGSGTPSPDNVRPISGYDSVVVSRYGKNLWSFASSGSKTSEGFIFPNASMPLVLPQGAYKFSAKASITNAIQLTFRNATDDVVATRIFTYTDVVDGKISYDFAFAESAYKASIYTNASASLTEIQLELGSTATDYEPYNGNTYTTDLSGTRYGGTLDVVSGVLTVTHKLVTLDGTETWFTNQAGYFALQKSSYDATLSTTEAYSDTMICNMLPYVYTQPSSQASFNAITHTIRVSMPNISTLADFKTWLGSNNLQFILQLATPTTVQLTAQEVELLVGLNQVWANSGDVSVEYGTAPNVLINPTLFESSPMLEVEGYGTIAFNGYEIELNNETLGDVTVLDNSTYTTRSKSFIFPSVLYNSGDTITVKNALFRWIVTHNESSSYTLVDFVSASDSLASAKTRIISRTPSPYSGHYETSYLSTAFESATFTAGTTSTLTDNVSAVFAIYNQSNLQFVENTTVTATWTIKYEVYDAENDMITLTWTSTDTSRASAFIDSPSLYSGTVVASSSISMLGHPTYIDCDLGECYRIDDDEYISLNHKVDLGSDLPKLGEGANTITYDDTVTDLKVIPRWWKI